MVSRAIAGIALAVLSIKFPPNIGQRCDRSPLAIGNNYRGSTIVRIDRLMPVWPFSRTGMVAAQTIGYIYTAADRHQYYSQKSAKQLNAFEMHVSLDFLRSATQQPSSMLQTTVAATNGTTIVPIGTLQAQRGRTEFADRVCAAWPPDVPIHP